eukprot:scaffold32944_cov83-Cyclotella_meneghiniana.AAC.4
MYLKISNVKLKKQMSYTFSTVLHRGSIFCVIPAEQHGDPPITYSARKARITNHHCRRLNST